MPRSGEFRGMVHIDSHCFPDLGEWRMKKLQLFVLMALVVPATMQAQPGQAYSHGDPTAEEQYMLELINRARKDPAAEGVRLMDTDDAAVQMAYQYFHIDKAQTKQAFTTYPERPPLAFHPALIDAARGHTADMIANNFQGHNSSNGDDLTKRYQNVSYQSQGMYGENVSAYSESVWYGHCGLNVDWGEANQQELGHRVNLMNFSNYVFTEIGIGISHTNGGLQSGTVGPIVITQDFGMRSTVYVTGVVYKDDNNNGFYDIGEGLAGVKIMPNTGNYYAVSSTSGGYAIPYSGSGSMTLTASGGALTGTMTLMTSLPGQENVKVDFVASAQLPTAVALRLPSNNATNVTPSSTPFTWSSAGSGSTYTIEIATAQNFAAATVITSQTTTDTTLTYSLPACQKRFFWRVRAANSAGNGPWSTVFALTTGGSAPGLPVLVSPIGAMTVEHDADVHFSWNLVPASGTYHIRISRNADLTNPIVDDSTIQATTFDVGAATIADQPFYWGVRAHGDPCGWGQWTIKSVTPTVTSVDEEMVSGPGLVVFPNPVTATSTLVMNVPAGGMATLRLVDAGGSVVVTRRIAVDAGRTAMPLSMLIDANVAQGIYGIVLSCDTYVQRVNVAVVR